MIIHGIKCMIAAAIPRSLYSKMTQGIGHGVQDDNKWTNYGETSETMSFWKNWITAYDNGNNG